MDRRTAIKTFAIAPAIAALPTIARAFPPTPPILCAACDREQCPNGVYLAGIGEWSKNVDIRGTLLDVLEICSPLGILDSGGIHIVPVIASTIPAPGVRAEPEALTPFEHRLPTTVDRVACDVIATRWVIARDALSERVGAVVQPYEITLSLHVRDAANRPRWNSVPFLRFTLNPYRRTASS